MYVCAIRIINFNFAFKIKNDKSEVNIMRKIILITLCVLLIVTNFTPIFAINSTDTDTPSMLSWVAFIVWVISSFFVWSIYHKMFQVYYFRMQGCVTELFICGFIGLVIAGVVIKYPYISIPLIILGLFIKRKKQS